MISHSPFLMLKDNRSKHWGIQSAMLAVQRFERKVGLTLLGSQATRTGPSRWCKSRSPSQLPNMSGGGSASIGVPISVTVAPHIPRNRMQTFKETYLSLSLRIYSAFSMLAASAELWLNLVLKTGDGVTHLRVQISPPPPQK